VLFFLELLDVS
jgi:NADH dehydrogenase (ubiquinone) Fe-S protein 8